ncbi:tRNA1(Val) (adenine(37)-N6)-methyltransferase [Flavobacteriaceae bacterium M23B6Z8]
MSVPFQFKQFTIKQDRCAMKVGTDGVLLGAWTPVEHQPFSILDIGAGTGLIALMLAQRTHAEIIDALEVNPDSYEQCVENFEASSWNDRLFCYHASLEEFVQEVDDTYDLIVSNPPFYTETYTSGDKARDIARQQQSMPPEELFHAVSKLLAPNGVFSIIIPYKDQDHILQIASQYALYSFKITNVRGTPQSAFKRSLLAFSHQQREIEKTTLTIETERHKYTNEYCDLTRDFYLKM